MPLLIIATLLAGVELPHYHLVIDPAHLEELYSDPGTDRLFPGLIESPNGTGECWVGFRGSTSLHLPKKSWRIDLDDPGLIGRTRLNLNAHYRDLTMMRDHLSMELARRMGLPAPLTRHVTLSVNGVNMGVYLETERIDNDYMLRNGLPHSVFFKGVEGDARFVPRPSGYDPAMGFSSRTKSGYKLPELIRFIGDVWARRDIEEKFDSHTFLLHMAAYLARVETDGPCKNFYLSLGSDSLWRFHPWDHDASFGNDWRGNFVPEYLYRVSTGHLQANTLFMHLIRDGENRQVFRHGLELAADVMANSLPAALDSIRNAIRADVHLDPLRHGTPEDFEAACDTLLWFIQERAGLVAGLHAYHRPPETLDLQISPSWFTGEEPEARIRVNSSEPLERCELTVIVDGDQVHVVPMEPVPGTGGRKWIHPVDGKHRFQRSLRFHVTARQLDIPDPKPDIFYPPYGLFWFQQYSGEAFPSLVRVERVPELELLQPGVQIRFGESLWALPLVNTGEHPMDLSLCAVSLGFPEALVFMGEDLILDPGDTLFVTSNLQAFSHEMKGRMAVGDCAAPGASGTVVTIMDPGWNPGAFHIAPPGERNARAESGFPMITEICYSQPLHWDGGNWLELYNPTGEWIDLSLMGVTDRDDRHTVFPAGTVMSPFGFLVLASDPDRFSHAHPAVTCQVMPMGFGLSSQGQTITFLDRAGNRFPLLSYLPGDPWPGSGEGIIAIEHPAFDQSSPESWVAVDQPGSPGAPNPVWQQSPGVSLEITGLRPNPSPGTPLHFNLSSAGSPLEALVLDLAGRIVHRRVILNPVPGEHILEPPESLPPGVYFLMVRQGGNTDTARFVWLP